MSEDDETGESPPEETPLRSIDGGKAKKKKRLPKRHGRITKEMYDRLCEIYLSGNRTIMGLAEASGVSYPTADKAIKIGWPANNWGPLSERARLYDKLHQDAQSSVSPERAKDARDWLQMRKDYIEIAQGIRIGLSQVIVKLLANVNAATATTPHAQRQVHFEEILDAAGRVIRRIPKTVVVDVQLAPSLHAIATSLSQIAGALERTGGGELEQLLANPPSGALGRKNHRLSPEQLKFMAENNGALPPGVGIDDLGDA